MPGSRRRPRRRAKVRSAPRHPYETLIGGISRDERLRRWYQRAVWSFFRAPSPPATDQDEADAAVARAFEWFAFDLVLPDSGKSPAVDWIHREAQQQRWSATVSERYLRFTRGQYGIFEVTAAAAPLFDLKNVHSGRLLQAVSADDWFQPEVKDFVAARLFPIESVTWEAGDPEAFVISPGSAVLPDTRRAVLRKMPADALAVETLFGASPDWMALALAEGTLEPVAGEFLRLITDEGMELDELRGAFTNGMAPDELVEAMASEIVALTPEEPALLMALLALFWVDEQHKSGVPLDALEARAAAWRARFEKRRKAQKDTARLDFDDAGEWRIPDSELFGLRGLSIDEHIEWIGRRRMVRAPIHEPGKLPVFPDAIVWIERPSGLVMNVTVVPQEAPPSAMLDALRATLSNARPDGRGRVLPGVVWVPSARWAAGLSSALAPLRIRAQVRCIEPGINDVFRSMEEHFGAADAGSTGTADTSAWRYLDLPDANATELARLHAAAAEFFRAAPWKVLDDTKSIAIQLPAPTRIVAPPCDRLLAVVMGNAGQTYGLALYFDERDLIRMEEVESADDIPPVDTISVTFDKERDTPSGVVDEISKHQWDIAGRQAYPTALRVSRRAPPRLVMGEETILTRAALDAVREFVAKHRHALTQDEAHVSDELVIDGVGRVLVSLLEDETEPALDQ